MENRIKEQMHLFADRLSTDEMKGNQSRLYFSALACALVEALRRLALKGTEWVQAEVDTIPARAAQDWRISGRRILLQITSAYPRKDTQAQAFHALLNTASDFDNRMSIFAEPRGGGAMTGIHPRPLFQTRFTPMQSFLDLH